MRHIEAVGRALFIVGLPLAGVFGGTTRSEAAPPDTDKCRVIQTKSNEVLVVCNYPFRPEATIEKVKEKCLVTKATIYPHRTLKMARLSTTLQKNCWGPSVNDYNRNLLKRPPKTLSRHHP